VADYMFRHLCHISLKLHINKFPLYTGTYRHTQAYTGTYRHTQAYTGTHRHIQAHRVTHRHIQAHKAHTGTYTLLLSLKSKAAQSCRLLYSKGVKIQIR
jgi:hypothetical protein